MFSFELFKKSNSLSRWLLNNLFTLNTLSLTCTSLLLSTYQHLPLQPRFHHMPGAVFKSRWILFEIRRMFMQTLLEIFNSNFLFAAVIARVLEAALYWLLWSTSVKWFARSFEPIWISKPIEHTWFLLLIIVFVLGINVSVWMSSFIWIWRATNSLCLFNLGIFWYL